LNLQDAVAERDLDPDERVEASATTSSAGKLALH